VTFRQPGKLHPFDSVPHAIALALFLLALILVGYKLGLGFTLPGGALVAVAQGFLQHRKSKRQLHRQQ
jgi:hypothetical protein